MPCVVVEIDADDHVGARELQPLDDVEPDPAEPEHHRLGAGLDLGGVDDRADPGRNPAADIANLVERRVLAHLRHRDLRQHREVREGRASPCSAGSARHRARSASVPSGIRPCPWVARIAVQRLVLRLRHEGHCAAFRRVERDHVVAFLHASHPGPTSTTTPAPSWPRIAGNGPSDRRRTG